MILYDSRNNAIIEIIDNGLCFEIIDLVNNQYISIDDSRSIQCVLRVDRKQLVSTLSRQRLHMKITSLGI